MINCTFVPHDPMEKICPNFWYSWLGCRATVEGSFLGLKINSSDRYEINFRSVKKSYRSEGKLQKNHTDRYEKFQN